MSVHYEGKLTDGTVFDSSYERGDPISFGLGAGQVIQGISCPPFSLHLPPLLSPFLPGQVLILIFDFETSLHSDYDIMAFDAKLSMQVKTDSYTSTFLNKGIAE